MLPKKVVGLRALLASDLMGDLRRDINKFICWQQELEGRLQKRGIANHQL